MAETVFNAILQFTSHLRSTPPLVSPTLQTPILNETERILQQNHYARIRLKYPDRVPCIVTRNPKNTNLPKLDKTKFIVPIDMTLGQFIMVLRRRIHLSSDQAIFLFIDNHLPPASETMGAIYSKYKNELGALSFVYAAENVFG